MKGREEKEKLRECCEGAVILQWPRELFFTFCVGEGFDLETRSVEDKCKAQQQVAANVQGTAFQWAKWRKISSTVKACCDCWSGQDESLDEGNGCPKKDWVDTREEINLWWDFLPGGYIHIFLSQQTKVIVSSVILSVSQKGCCCFFHHNSLL